MFYYERHMDLINNFYASLDKMIETEKFKNKRVVVFSVNNLAGMIVYYLRQHGIETCAIIDNQKKYSGSVVYGVDVYTPQQYAGRFQDDLIFLIASYYQNEICKQLENFGYKANEHIIQAIDMLYELDDFSYSNRDEALRLDMSQIKESHKRILKNLDEVCRTNGLRYWIAYGTLLGAVRHKGYIPWDDDVDVMMPMKDMKRLSEIMTRDGRYSLISCFDRDVEYYNTEGLLTDNETICDCNNVIPQITTGITIDVFPLIGIPDDKAQQKKYFNKLKDLDACRMNKIRNAAACREACDEEVKYMLEWDFDRYDLVGSPLVVYLREIHQRAWFDNTIKLQFEELELNAPGNWDGFLRNRYGNYMKLPPQKKRVGHHFYRAYSLDK